MKNSGKAVLSLGIASMMLLAPAATLGQTEPPPLPLHGVEGYGGVFATYTAYMANQPKDGIGFGKPSAEGVYVHLGNGREMTALTLTETYGDRLELGLGWDIFDMGDLPRAIHDSVGTMIAEDSVHLFNANARYMLLKEQADQPAVTLGVHYKTNSDIQNMDNELSGTLTSMGVTDDHGWDYTLYATKMIKAKRPTMVSLGLRSSKAAHLGLLGFTNDRDLTPEGNICVLATDRLVLAAEYRRKPNNYAPIPGLIDAEDDWWTLCAGYIVNSNCTIGAGYGHFGSVLNHKANKAWGVKVKYEF